MDKRKKIIIIWMLTLASLLVVVLYSPLGSPELYKEANPVTYHGVNFSNIDIANVSKIRNQVDNNSNQVTYQEVNFSNIDSANVSKIRNQVGNNSGAISVPNNNETMNYTYKISENTSNNKTCSYTAIQEDNFSLNQSSQSIEMNPQFGSIGAGSKSSKRSVVSLGGNQSLSLNSDLSSVNNSPFHRATQDELSTETIDPGGDPTGDPIPVGDGWVFLILLSVAYFVAKKYFFNAK
jgi:hypothetical protein